MTNHRKLHEWNIKRRIVGDTRVVYPEKGNFRVPFKVWKQVLKLLASFKFENFKINPLCSAYDSFWPPHMYTYIHLTNYFFTYCMPGTLPCTGNVGITKIDKVLALMEFCYSVSSFFTLCYSIFLIFFKTQIYLKSHFALC